MTALALIRSVFDARLGFDTLRIIGVLNGFHFGDQLDDVARVR